jgi:PKD repeat protein
MHRARTVLPRVCVQLLAAALVIACVTPPAMAQTVPLTHDYDLVTGSGLVHYAQTDGRWAYFNVRGDQTVTIGRCGCLLSTFATVINQHGGIAPWFPTPFNFFGGSDGAFDFNPRYLDVFFNFGPNPSGAPLPPGSPPPLSFPAGWGYKAREVGTCGVIPLLQALQIVGTDGLGAAVGFTPIVHYGFGPDVTDIVNRNLIAGRPTIAAIRVGESLVANHAVLIAGWDQSDRAYKILDPMTPRVGLHGLNLPQVPYDIDAGDPPGTVGTYEKWEMRVEGIIEMRVGGFGGSVPSFLFGDDPSPIEILMTAPDGRRTGVDHATGASFSDNAGASYWTFGPWLDPLGEIPEGVAPRFIVFPNAPAGTYHFEVTGTADGPLELSAETLFGGRRVLLGEFGGTIAEGEVRKYELQFSRTGVSAVAQVSNFTPHAYAGDDLHARTDAPLTFDGRRSFDADGAIASFEWDFGDGATGVGAQPQHVYTVPGDYIVTLTVTDANGVTATDSLQADVILSQRRPIADASGPYLGFASTRPEWYVLLDARGSSDPNGEPLTYRWDFGDGSPIRTTGAAFTDHVYAAIGVYTMTVVANDGLEDSVPATATVEIVQAPTEPPFGALHADMTPTCGLPGDAVTIAMGEFAQFQWWNFGTMGALPSFPPRRLPLGLSAPDGHMDLRLPGAEREFVPFHATLLGPGRYIARATFTVPALAPGLYGVGWAEDDPLPFRVPCPVPDNQRPQADAGGPYSSGVGSPIAFDGSASTDPDGDELEYEWDFGDGTFAEGVRPSHSYAHEGRYIVTLIVGDGESSSGARAGTRSFASAIVTAGSLDTIPPTTTAVIAPAGSSDGWNTTDVLLDLRAVDNPGGSGVRDIAFALSGAHSDTATVPGDMAQVVVSREGTTDVAYFATDNAGNRESPQHRAVRIDRTGPTIAGMPGAACSLWPPNHKLVTVAHVSASDGVSGLAPEGLVLTATSSEPENAVGDGNTGPDVVITGGSVALRAERSGTGVGRAYTITATATDRAGNTTRTVSVCVVPHDQRPGR